MVKKRSRGSVTYKKPAFAFHFASMRGTVKLNMMAKRFEMARPQLALFARKFCCGISAR